MIKKVMLIYPASLTLRNYPKTVAPPLGVAYLAGALEKKRFEVKIIDATMEGWKDEVIINKEYIRYGLSIEEIGKRIRDFSPDAVGVSCILSSQHKEMHGICRITKSISTDIVTIVGGVHPTVLPEETLSDKNIDFVVLGEGESVLTGLLLRINMGRDYKDLDGLAFRDNGTIQVSPKENFIDNLDRLPYPARHLLPMDKYFAIARPQSLTWRKKPNISLITSRGCGASCIFCSTTKYWGNHFRARSASNVLEEIDYLIKEYGIKEVHFIDDNLLSDRNRALELIEGLKNRKMSWQAPHGLAVWTLDRELLRRLKESGCYEITLGIDSGDKEVLNKIIRKPLDLDLVPPLVKEMKRLKLGTKAYFIIGFPGETIDNIKNTFSFAKSLNLDATTFFAASPLPGTELYRICSEKNYLDKKFNWRDLNFGKAVIKTEEFFPKQIEKWVQKENLLINLRMFFRNPIGFIRKFGIVIIKNPRIFYSYFLSLFRLNIENISGKNRL